MAATLAAVLTATLVVAGPATARAPPATRGVAVDVVFGEPIALALQDVETAAALGGDAIRVSIQWSNMEPQRRGDQAAYYRDALDAVVARAKERGLGVLLTPVFTPCWASRTAHGLLSFLCGAPGAAAAFSREAPARMADYAAFMAFLAKRYGDALVGLEVWNEPNLPGGFWETRDPVADYAALVRATFGAVKRVAPDVPVVAGALAGAGGSFLAALYALEFKGYYDVLSVHAYNDGRPPDALLAPGQADATFLQGLRELARILRRNGETRPVWLTETGWNTSTQRGQPFIDGVTEEQQATYLTQAFELLGDPRSGVDFPEAVFVYRLRDVGVDPADPQQNYGLQRKDGTPKPALAAVRAAFARPR